MVSRPRISCLVNNYNYGPYVTEAVDSARAQTVPFDEILVVDDGSTDDSVSRLSARYAGDPVVRILAKANGGQLSAFNEGFLHSTGDLVFFLDADDLYEPTHVEQMAAVYVERPHTDFVFCGYRLFGQQEAVRTWLDTDQSLGFSLVYSLHFMHWVGAPTSCLSLRRRTLEKILPLPMLEDWRTRADDCLV
ncbi:MAG TPA: glycosyltransferase family A protein, partial [Pirellulales bacterium]|nr:glycosyltransferase family A protein [Pirellulales bacterium]